HIAACGLFESNRADPLHERNHPPHVVVAGAHCRHFRSPYAVAYGAEQLPVRAAMTVLAVSEVCAPAALAPGAMAIRTVGLKQTTALFGVLGRVKRILLQRRGILSADQRRQGEEATVYEPGFLQC